MIRLNRQTDGRTDWRNLWQVRKADMPTTTATTKHAGNMFPQLLTSHHLAGYGFRSIQIVMLEVLSLGTVPCNGPPLRWKFECAKLFHVLCSKLMIDHYLSRTQTITDRFTIKKWKIKSICIVCNTSPSHMFRPAACPPERPYDCLSVCLSVSLDYHIAKWTRNILRKTAQNHTSGQNSVFS